VIPVCLKVAGVQAVVLWQSSQTLLVVKWVADLPVAFVPLWQDAQFAVMPLWSKLAPLQVFVDL
jgi:hypothetical protein